LSAPVAIGALALAVLAVIAYGPALTRWAGERKAAPKARRPVAVGYDPGRERRAERKAEELLRSVVSPEEYAMYRELGFLTVSGAGRDESGYAYLIYPHRPIVAYDTSSGELLNEYCVAFPDEGEDGGRLPDSDDVLAKWMSLRGDERELVGVATMHVPGWQVDPGQVRRDLVRLREWEARARARRAKELLV
jgi:hypothetical protein